MVKGNNSLVQKIKTMLLSSLDKAKKHGFLIEAVFSSYFNVSYSNFIPRTCRHHYFFKSRFFAMAGELKSSLFP